MLHRSVDEFFDAGEFNDRIKLSNNLSAPHPENCAVHKNVVSARKLGMEPGAHFEKRTDAAVNFCVPRGGFRDSRQYFEERAFTRSVSADYADDFTALHLKGDVP